MTKHGLRYYLLNSPVNCDVILDNQIETAFFDLVQRMDSLININNNLIMGSVMREVFKKIMQLHRKELIDIINSKARLAFRISDKRVYFEYEKSQKYHLLYKRFKHIIQRGVEIKDSRQQGRNIWMCWLQGIDNAPMLVKRCIQSVETMAENDKYNVILLSIDNLSDYISLPDFVIKKWKRGIISTAHFTDIIRTELLCEYGGMWIDATVLCTTKSMPNYIFNNGLFFYQDINWGNLDIPSSVMSNWLIYSDSNNPILLLTRELLYNYWQQYDYLVHYFIYHMFFSMAAQRYPEEYRVVPLYSNEPPRIMQRELLDVFNDERWEQLLSMSDFHKLKWQVNDIDEDSILYYIINSYN